MTRRATLTKILLCNKGQHTMPETVANVCMIHGGLHYSAVVSIELHCINKCIHLYLAQHTVYIKTKSQISFLLLYHK